MTPVIILNNRKIYLLTIKCLIREIKLEEVKFTLKPVDTKPLSNKNESKYDPILDAFFATGASMAQVELENYNTYYINSQIKNRIKKNNFENIIDSSVVNKCIYLEILEPLKTVKEDLEHAIVENVNVDVEDAKKIIGIIYEMSSDYIFEK